MFAQRFPWLTFNLILGSIIIGSHLISKLINPDRLNFFLIYPMVIMQLLANAACIIYFEGARKNKAGFKEQVIAIVLAALLLIAWALAILIR